MLPKNNNAQKESIREILFDPIRMTMSPDRDLRIPGGGAVVWQSHLQQA
jgi:hypothetical protein